MRFWPFSVTELIFFQAWTLPGNGKITRVYRTLPEFTGNYRRLPEITGDYRTLPRFTGLYRDLPDFTGDYRKNIFFFTKIFFP